MSTITIPLSQGKVGIIDVEDFPFVSQWKWHASRYGNTFYVMRRRRVSDEDGASKIALARELLNAPGGMVVDHINGDGLDNRRCNLRVVTQLQNTRNRRSATGSTSKYLGVCWHKGDRRWQAAIKVEHRNIYLGQFADEAEAARAYDRAALLRYGPYARLNFPVALASTLRETE